MPLRKRIAAAAFVLVLGTSGAGAATIYVRAAASGANNGTSWTNAYTSLQTALAAAVPTDEIWVAAGNYQPTTTTDRTISFALKDGVGIYGGFNGTETMRSQRNPAANPTNLTGDIGAVGVATDNSYHVVTSDASVTSTGILDGFTIASGRADGLGDPTDRGGGVYTTGGSPAFVRCLFTNNYGNYRGGAVRVASGSPSFTDCTFQGNGALEAGGGISAASVGSLQIKGCVFRSNNAISPCMFCAGGGAIEATNNTTVVNSVVAQNSPSGMGFLGGGNSFVNTTIANNSSYGVVFLSNPNTIANSILYNNPNGAIFLGISGIATVSYSDVQGGAPGTGNTIDDPRFVNAPSDLRLGSGSAAVDAGNNAAVPGGVTSDIAGLPRFFDDPGAPNVGAGTPPLVDMGAHERVPLSVSSPSPPSQTVCAGASASFSVTASGSPTLTYQWRKAGMNLTNGGAISGATTAMLTINPTATGHSGSYDVVVTDGFGQSITSLPASLTVNGVPPAPVATNSGPICEGETLQLSASTIPNASYVWTGPGSFVSIQQNPTIATANQGRSGTYSVTANVAGCLSPPGTTDAVVNPSPFVQITAPQSVCPNSGGNGASVPDAGVGATYSWMITNGTITAGAGTRSITFTAGGSGSVIFFVTVHSGAGCPAATSTSVTIMCPTSFFTVAPCRVVDTRDTDGPWGGPALAAGATRLFTMTARCTLPSSARAVSLNVVVTGPTALGYLSLYPGGTPQPLASTVNYQAGQTRANNAIVPLGADGSIAVTCGQTSGTTHVIIDVTGYFE